MVERKKVYVETTVISDATALPTRDLVQAGRQLVTREWWNTAAERFDLFSSNVVANEARRGDPDAAKRRIDALQGIPELKADEKALALASELIARKAVSPEYPDDALHIATAALNGMDYLVSWNFKHITNAHTIPLVERICREKGYACPCICTPQMLQEGGREWLSRNDTIPLLRKCGRSSARLRQNIHRLKRTSRASWRNRQSVSDVV